MENTQTLSVSEFQFAEIRPCYSCNRDSNFLDMSKVYPNATAALDGLLHDNMTIAAGGSGCAAFRKNLIAALRDNGVKGLTIVGNNAGVDGFGMEFCSPHGR